MATNRKPQTQAQKTVSPAAVPTSPAPAPVTTRLTPLSAPVQSPAPVRTLAEVNQEIAKVSAALDTARTAGFTDIEKQADKRLSALHAEKASLSPAPAPVRQSAAVVEDVVAAPVSAVSAAPSAFVVAELKTDAGKLLGILTAAGKQFNTGSRGYYANGKVEIGGKRYQVQVQLVEIGSKPAADGK